MPLSFEAVMNFRVILGSSFGDSDGTPEGIARQQQIRDQWAALEKEVGRAVTEQEIWNAVAVDLEDLGSPEEMMKNAKL